MSSEQLALYQSLQDQFATSFDHLISDVNSPKTVVIIPSLTLDQQIMSRISGVHHYEERMLCLLLLLRMPRTKVIFVTSTPIHDSIIDYYLHLLPGVPTRHSRARLSLLSCYDSSPVALSKKILDRPRLMEAIRQQIPDASVAHMSCFTVTETERKLALELGIPIFGCDPSLLYWGSKSGSRKVFKEAGVDMPLGFEDLTSDEDIVHSLAEMKTKKPEMTKAVIKVNEGFSGEGNALINLKEAPVGRSLRPWIYDQLNHLNYVADGMSWETFIDKFNSMGGIVEEFIPGEIKTSPSAQFRIDPLGRLSAISTHDQVLEGDDAQTFTGCRFPADEAYRYEIQAQGFAAAEVLAKKGVQGRFGVDFISVKENSRWKHYAIEINLRKGGTTHPFLMLQFLIDGHYDPQTGQYLTYSGAPRCYYASDNLESQHYQGLTPDDLIDISVMNGLHFHAAIGEGVAFHLIGALSEFGKLGIVSIGETSERADALYQKTVQVMNKECL